MADNLILKLLEKIKLWTTTVKSPKTGPLKQNQKLSLYAWNLKRRIENDSINENNRRAGS